MRTAFLAIASVAALAAAAAATAPTERLYDLYMRENLVAAGALCDSLLAASPDDPALVHLRGRILADTYEFAAAVPHLEAAAADASAPAWVRGWAEHYLGVCAQNAGDGARARELWTKVCEDATTRNVAATTDLYLSSLHDDPRYADWTALDTEHFEFRFSPALGDLDHAGFAARHEAAHAFVAAWCGAAPDRPIRYFVWSDRHEARRAGLPELGFNRAKVSLVHVLLGQAAGHETAHVLSLRTIKPLSYAGLISEGLAVFLDMTQRDRLATAREALRGHDGELSVRALWNDWGALPEAVSYPVAGAFVQMLVEKGGREKFLALFRDQGLDRARGIYGEALEEWIAGFERDLSR
jgi:hypothetical protein